ncbi:MAG: hypothetical protein CVV44_21545 [Spirochaetae bacterium HGW-Spirochaetae-1]|jgi:hypothetical protein|nr:MAG: hypothetical protein CVV44_21545 [Spirochaetae bacterium HGW-Spirochaetae-1]
MMRKIITLIFPFLLLLSACSESQLGTFQQNEPDPDFVLLTMMEDYGSLQEIFDTVLSKDVNKKLSETIKANSDEFVDFLAMTRDILGIVDEENDRRLIDSVLIELEQLMGYLVDSSPRHYNNTAIDSYYSQNGSGSDYLLGFYHFLDKLSQSDANIGGDALAVGHAAMQYILDNNENIEVQNTVQGLIDIVTDDDPEDGFKADLVDISETLSKLLIRGDYPMWVESDGDLITDYDEMVSGTNTGLGNMVKGLVSLVQGLSKVMMYDPVAKEYLFDIIREGASLVSENNAVKLEKLACNLESHFTKGGDIYESSDYNNPNEDGDGIYVNAELGNTLREMWPGLLKLFISADKDEYSIYKNDSGVSPLEYIVQKIGYLKEIGIDFSSADYANGELEQSVLDMFTRDGMGRLRKTDSEAYDVSYIDHLLFALVASYNFGYLASDSDDDDPVSNHGFGHGEVTDGIITTNDCMYSLGNGYLLLEDMTNAYELALAKRIDQSGHIGRSHSSFRSPGEDEEMSRKFYMGADYPPMLLLPPTCAGDSGIPNGGNSGIIPTSDETVVGGDNDYRTYYPRTGNGTGELNTARWVMGWIARACWEGEGPYYYAPEKAGNSAPTLTYDYDRDGTAELFRLYNKANGDVYAMVHKPDPSDASTWVYLYPTNDSDGEEVGDYYADENDISNKGKVLAEEVAINGTTVSHRLYNTPVVPGSVKIERTEKNTHDFNSGDITWTNNGEGNRSVLIDSQLSNHPVIEGSINRIRVKEAYNLFNLYNDSADIYFKVNADGTLTQTYENGTAVSSAHNCIAASGFNYATGEFYLLLSNPYSWADENGDGLIEEDEKEYLNYKVTHAETWYESTSASAVDDGSGNITGTAFSGTGHIDYGTGRITGTLTSTALVYCDYSIATISAPGMAFDGKRQRTNRYRATWKSDYYLLEEGTKGNYCRPPMTENGSRYVEGTSGDDKYLLLPGEQRASRFTFTEKIAENDDVRECSSQEEAMVRNFQWLMLEKKYTFIIPMWVYALNMIHSGAFIVIEGNGVLGLSNAKPGDWTGKWLYDRANDGEGSRETGRSPEYYESDVPGDARIIVLMREHNLIDMLGLAVGMNLDVIWNNILGRGHVLPDAVASNIPPIPRMAFLQEKLVPSDATGNEVETYYNAYDEDAGTWQSGSWGEAWSHRSRLFPAIVALAGSLHETTYYEPAATGHDYNWGGNHKYPFKDLLGSLVPPLAKPMMRYLDVEGGRWVGRINQGYDSGTEEGALEYLTPICTAPGLSGQSNVDPIDIDHRPRRGLRMLTSFLAENETKQCDGLVPAMAEKSIVTKLLAMLQRMGDSSLLNGLYSNADGKKHATHDLFSGLEQLATAVKTTKGEVIEKEWNDQGFNDNKWKWMFAEGEDLNDEGEYDNFSGVRDVDIVLDDLIYALVGHDYVDGSGYEGKGLAALPDDGQRELDERLALNGFVVQDSLANDPVPGTLSITVEGVGTATDNGSGVITGDFLSSNGTVDYDTGDIYFVLDSNVVGDDASVLKVRCAYTFNRNWNDFYEDVADMEEFLSADGKYAIVENLINVLDGALAINEEFTDKEVAGLLYTVGKLLAQYDGDSGKWIYHGEEGFDYLYTILHDYLPVIHETIKDPTGHNYGAMMTLLADMLKPGGLMGAVMDSAYSSAEYEEIFDDLHNFLIEASTPGTSINRNIWPVLVDLLEDLGKVVQETNEGGEEAVKEVFESYGFQYNG